MRTITAIIDNITAFVIPAVARTRLEAMQPAADFRDSLDLEYFLGQR